ncbi:MAG: histidine kinase [Prolixibacteraceae bacterium]|nr:histidine kinase [Prolixibacteraceae bacterium]
MKTIIFYLAFLLVSILLTLSSNAKQVQVKFNENEELIYEWTEKEVFLPANQKPVTDRYLTNRFSLVMGKISDNKLSFTAQIIKKTERFLQSDEVYAKDYAFPQMNRFFWKMQDSDLPEEILYQVQFKYELDLNTNSIQLTNRVEILEQCHGILSNKGYSDQIRSSVIERINKKALQLQSDVFLMPFIFLNGDLDQPTIKSEKLGADLSVVKRNDQIVELANLTPDSIKKLSCQIDLQTRLLTNLSEEKALKRTEKGSSLMFAQGDFKLKKVSELKLVKRSIQKSQNIVVCGRIENPVNDHIVLYTLNRAFGSELDSKDVYLDKAGNFRIETKLLHSGLVILVQPNKKQNVSSATYLLYAEPGDSIYIKTQLTLNNESKTFLNYESVEFSGDRKAEAEFLMKYQQEWGIPPFNSTNVRLPNGEGSKWVETYLSSFDKLTEMLQDHKKGMSTESASFIEHELQAIYYSKLYDAMPERLIPQGVRPGINLIPEHLESMVNNRLDTVQIQRIYNDYGIFSRDLAMRYVWYKYRQIVPANPIMPRFTSPLSGNDLERTMHFTKMVLSGSALYRTIAQQLNMNLIANGSFYAYESADIWQSYALETLEFMQKRSSDEAFCQEIEALISNQLQWRNSRYVPNTKFLDSQRKESRLGSLISKKPTIVFTGTNWSVGRYEMDDEVKKHPEFNFILINEGNNFDLWKDWNDRAESTSHQLFLLNDSLRLTDIFLENLNSYIIYNASGERIGFEKDLGKAVSIAEESLKPKKKEINQSTLQGIVIILLVSMVFFLILFLLYKYRMKQRLKKQMQEKRLRELQMAAIRAQMNPHFLFNSLNSVQNLIQQNRAQEAHLYLSDFAGLIRKVLRNSDKEEVSLAEELETLEQYLHLEKLRFDFEYAIEVDKGIDQNLFMLPSMILQPVAENALMHGLQHKTGDKKLSFQIQKIGSSIQIIIEDNGVGIEAAKKLKTNSNGVGLRMNEERIRMMKEKYGGNYSFKLIDLTEQGMEGTRVEIVIPEEQ